MPRVNIWVRQEDWKHWQGIPDKPQWLHDKLANDSFTPITKAAQPGLSTYPAVLQELNGKPLYTEPTYEPIED